MQKIFSFKKEPLVICNAAGQRLDVDTARWALLLHEDFPKSGFRPPRILQIRVLEGMPAVQRYIEKLIKFDKAKWYPQGSIPCVP